VAIAMLTPAWPMYGMEELDRKARRVLDTFARGTDEQRSREEADYEALMLADIAREGVAPLSRAEHRLTPWSSFLVVPIFALANAGVSFAGTGFWQAITSRVALGVLVGLVVGKTVGITLFSWLAVRLGLGRLPAGTGWGHMVGVAATAGIGFTVALFIAALAFTDPLLAAQAKVGIFAGSILAGLIGSLILSTRRRKASGEAPAREPVAARS
jgi:NhaA family Na+:H+ antiporter